MITGRKRIVLEPRWLLAGIEWPVGYVIVCGDYQQEPAVLRYIAVSQTHKFPIKAHLSSHFQCLHIFLLSITNLNLVSLIHFMVLTAEV